MICPKCKEEIDYVDYSEIVCKNGTYNGEEYEEDENSAFFREIHNDITYTCPCCNEVLDDISKLEDEFIDDVKEVKK
jgi:hypothetical protein